MTLLDLPNHVFVQIASHLDFPSLKSLAVAHSLLTPAAETWLFRRLTLPLSNPHRPVGPTDTDTEPISWECDYNLSTQWEPVKPTLSSALEGYGWREDTHQSNHLDASLRFVTACIVSKPERAGYVREISVDLKKRYHDVELDMNSASTPTTTTTSIARATGAVGAGGAGSGSGYRGEMWFDGKEWGWEWDDPLSSLRAMTHLAQARQAENPDQCPLLRGTFDNLPPMRGVRKLELEVYESWQGYLPHLLAAVPNLDYLVIRPNALLVDSPLHFPAAKIDNLPPGLKEVRVESMLDCFQPLVVDLLDRCQELQHLVLADRERGSRRQWSLTVELAEALATSPSLRRLELGRAARDALRDYNPDWDGRIVLSA